jgi:nucleoside permease NupC
MLAINVMQMAMIEVIDMVLMANGGVATAWAMNVRTCTSRLISAGHRGVPFLFGCVLAASRLRNRVFIMFQKSSIAGWRYDDAQATL